MPQNVCDNPFLHGAEHVRELFKEEKNGKDIAMKWYRDLYLDKKIRQDKEKLIKKLETNTGVPGLYLVTLAANERDLFDIFSSDLLLQPVLHGHCPLIVGLARGYSAAVSLATGIAMETYRENGDFDVQKFLQSRIPDGEDMVYEYPMEHLKKRKRSRFKK